MCLLGAFQSISGTLLGYKTEPNEVNNHQNVLVL